MRKNVGLLLWMFLSIIVASCTDVYKEDGSEKEKEIVPPGETYTPEKQYNLNVVYYIPSDVPEVEDWHYRLSGVTLHIQNYFYENFMRYRVDNKFGLELNDVNPEFVRVHYIKSNKKHLDMQETNMKEMAQEVLNYFKQNPDSKQSDHYLIYMPKYEGSFIKHYYPSANEGMAFCGVDDTKWNIKYFASARARATFLDDLGNVLKVFAQSLFLEESDTGADSPFRALLAAKYTTTGGNKYLPQYNYVDYSGTPSTSSAPYVAGTPDKVRLMIWDIRYLNGIQIFNDNYSYKPFEVDIKSVDIRSKEGATFEEDTIKVQCKFAIPADLELAGVVMFDDPWRTYVNGKFDDTLDKDENYESGWDAYGVYVEAVTFEKEGDIYVADFVLPIVNHMSLLQKSSGTTVHELRFRFIGKNGMAYPHVPTSIKGPFEAPLRNVFNVIGKYNFLTGITTYTHDIATRYGVWHGVEEE